MSQKYQSRWTAQQIDSAIRKVLRGKITSEDLDSSLLEQIDVGGEFVFSNHYEFPNIGKEKTLYIALDEELIYYWKDDKYVPFQAAVRCIDCGGASDGESN